MDIIPIEMAEKYCGILIESSRLSESYQRFFSIKKAAYHAALF